jgi:hypothetical protein
MNGLHYLDANSENGSTAENTRRSTWSDRLVNARESFLDVITGKNPRPVLNAGEPAQPDRSGEGADLTAELKRFMDMVRSGVIDEQGLNVDYRHLKGSPVYLEYHQSCSPRLKNFDPAQLTTREEKLAFWINLYNALIIDGVIAGEVAGSVGPGSLALLRFFRKTAYNVAGSRFSADDIEHGILRSNHGHPMIPGPQFTTQDPRLAWIINPLDERIHFALNCAGRSCPPIQVYTPEDIDQQLHTAALNFVNTDLQIDKSGKAYISAIFKWFSDDFGGQQGVIDFLIQYLDHGEDRDWLEKNRCSIKLMFKTYDWGLNSVNAGIAV